MTSHERRHHHSGNLHRRIEVRGLSCHASRARVRIVALPFHRAATTPSSLVAREARRQTRKVLNPDLAPVGIFRGCRAVVPKPKQGRAILIGLASRNGRRPSERRIRALASGRGQRGCDRPNRSQVMSIGLILVVLLVIFLLGGFSGRLGGYGYGFGNGGISVLGVLLIVVVVMLLTGRL
jgi:hypothetical protein